MSFYAVAKGRTTGVFLTWAECQSQVSGVSGAVYKKFKTRKEAASFACGEIVKTASPTPDYVKRDGEWVVFTDGACPNNGRGATAASWAVVWPFNEEWNDKGRLPGDKWTNIRAELYGVLRAMEIAATHLGPRDEVRIYTDSEFTINVVHRWSHAWKQRNWLNVKNLDLVQRIHQLAHEQESRPQITLHFVRAHSGARDFYSTWNDAADRAANSAL